MRILNLNQANASKQAKNENKLKDLSKEDFVAAMNTWTKLNGHPVVTVKKLNSTHISLRQNKFLLDSLYPIETLRRYYQ
jgi:aminopeptidase N